MASAFTSPVILTGSVTVNPGSDGVIPATALANPLGLPLELLEIRFRVWAQTRLVPNIAGYYSNLTGQSLGIKLDVGKVPLVDPYTPIGLLGSTRDSHGDQTQDLLAPARVQRLQPLYQPGQTTGTYFSSPTVYGWRLKYPLFLPVSAVPSLVVRPLGQNVYPVQVDVAYICQTWDMTKPQPKQAKAPWAASYNSQTVDLNNGSPGFVDQSSNLNLYNPFNDPLELVRLSGRLARIGAPSPGSDALAEDTAEIRYFNSLITMRSSRGFDIVRTGVPFGGLFPYSWKVWDMPPGWTMTPREFYTCKAQVPPFTDANGTFGGQAQFAVGMIGYHRVPVSALVEGA